MRLADWRESLRIVVVFMSSFVPHGLESELWKIDTCRTWCLHHLLASWLGRGSWSQAMISSELAL